jgi:hypothetical protein
MQPVGVEILAERPVTAAKIPVKRLDVAGAEKWKRN